MQALDQRLKKLDSAAALLEYAKDNIYEAGHLVNDVNGQVTGVVGNPNRNLIELIVTKMLEIKELALRLRRENA